MSGNQDGQMLALDQRINVHVRFGRFKPSGKTVLITKRIQRSISPCKSHLKGDIFLH
jgi:hypothetical protein